MAGAAPGVAAADAAKDEPKGFGEGVQVQGFQGVCGAGGLKAAASSERAGEGVQHGREEQAIEVDQQ